MNVSSRTEVVDKLKSLGFQSDREMRLYGEHFKFLSDPFEHEGIMVVRARSWRSSSERVVGIPRLVVEAAKCEPHLRKAA